MTLYVCDCDRHTDLRTRGIYLSKPNIQILVHKIFSFVSSKSPNILLSTERTECTMIVTHKIIKKTGVDIVSMGVGKRLEEIEAV